MVKGEYSSYKDLPVSLYQIQTKYRDEARPRAGILRGREFVMKDSYSFDIDDAGLAISYGQHRRAYESTFAHLGLDYVIVSAQAGAMGGSKSEEFLAPCEHGEDTFARCQACGFAANVEAVTTVVEAAPDEKVPTAHVEDTPEAATIDALVTYANGVEALRRPDRDWSSSDTLKNVVVMLVGPDGSQTPLAIGLPGDREVDLKRLGAVVHPAEVRPFEAADFAKYPQFVKGYIGPGALGAEKGVRYLLDPRVVPGSRWITGADQPGKHVFDAVAERDFSGDGVIEAAEVLSGDPCPNCGEPLALDRGIEIGHIFQLGRKYAEALELKVLDENGRQVTVTMGSYGIGVSRAVAAVVEQHHDDKGIVWPRSIAPADVHLVAAGKDDAIFEAGEVLASGLVAAGLNVLYDDRRSASAGVKFNDAELIGIPTIVVVGKRLGDGVVEVKDRRSGERQDVELVNAVG